MTGVGVKITAARSKRQLLCVLVSVALLLAVPAIPGRAESGSIICGDANHDDIVNIGDVVYLVAFIFKGGAPPEPLCSGDVNGDGEVNLGDGVYLIAYIFKGGAPPSCAAGGEITGFAGCKSFWEKSKADIIPPDQSCIEYQYDGAGFLSLRHINAGFNCCPEEIFVDVVIDGNVIILTESEASSLCDCQCLFDLEIGVYFLEPGQYTIRVVEPYLPPGGEPLEFAIDLIAAPSGIYCVYRGSYPWTAGSEPSGEVTGYTSCKSFAKIPASGDPSPDQDCIAWEYDGFNTLALRHINAGFNCCPLEFPVEFTFAGNRIIITENEVLDNGGCMCLCLFDISYEISGIMPGEYVIRVNGMYLQGENPEIEFTVDLAASPSGLFCVDRDYYPWGYY